ncbi:hypothetical protein F4781DRAFT_28916 [Annulohypoxylon bovei var. microspora]|nr:hypothetical protein F4781DRAFT_28916 [Annulohypoxylon bovei var. microspora]
MTPGALPGDTRRDARVETATSREDATALRMACRARQIRLATALHAPIVADTERYRRSTTSAATQHKTTSHGPPSTLRKYCPAPFDGPSQAPPLRMVAIPLSVDASAERDTSAASIQSLYQQSVAPAHRNLMHVRVPFVEKATKMLATASPTTEPYLSNLGVTDDYADDYAQMHHDISQYMTSG